MRRLRVESEDRERLFPLPPAGELRLGSARDNDIVLNDTGVSRQHARLTTDHDGVHFVDLGSKNKLIVDGVRHHEVFLAPGTSVQIGNALVTLQEVADADGQVAVAMDDSSSVAAFSATGTDKIDSRPEKSSRGALAVIRRFIGRRLEDETRTRFLVHVGDVLNASVILRFYKDESDGIVLADASGPVPASPILADLAGLAAAPEPRLQTLSSGPACYWHGTPESGILAALAATPPEGDEPAPWISDFLIYISEQLAAESTDPTTDSGTTEPPPADLGQIQVPPGMIVGTSPAMRALMDEVRASLLSRHDVLVYGETGTGKELFTQLLHRSGPTSDGPFVAINCAAIPAELLEAELFGVEKRVATGVDPRPGLFRQAEGGTLLLDEIADLPAPLQAKLLRALQEREVLPLGSGRTIKVNLRVISTSNCQLRDRVDAGSFRADLYYRLDRLRFTLPPLRERLEDLPSLVRTLARRAAEDHQFKIRGFSLGALEVLEKHHWPGNIRELDAAVGRAVVRGHGGVLESQHFNDLTKASKSTLSTPTVSPPILEPPPKTLKERIDAEERRALREAMAATGGNRSQAAKRLAISRQGLIDKLRRHSLADKPSENPQK